MENNNGSDNQNSGQIQAPVYDISPEIIEQAIKEQNEELLKEILTNNSSIMTLVEQGLKQIFEEGGQELEEDILESEVLSDHGSDQDTDIDDDHTILQTPQNSPRETGSPKTTSLLNPQGKQNNGNAGNSY